jgi:hypothetical protein
MSSDRYIRGAFAVFDPQRNNTQANKNSRLIPFRFNPEGLTRSLQIEQAQDTQSNEGADQRRARSGGANAQQLGDAADGPLKHTFTINVRFDLIDREEGQQTPDAETLSLGVLPELSALEELMHPAQSATTTTARDAVAPRPARPTVLLVWGLHRVFPVRVVSMTINETLHNGDLAPIRAEVEIGLEVARDDATGDPRITEALGYMQSQRTQHAQRFYQRASLQGTSVTGLGNLADTKLRTT